MMVTMIKTIITIMILTNDSILKRILTQPKPWKQLHCRNSEKETIPVIKIDNKESQRNDQTRQHYFLLDRVFSNDMFVWFMLFDYTCDMTACLHASCYLVTFVEMIICMYTCMYIIGKIHKNAYVMCVCARLFKFWKSARVWKV